MSNRAYRDNYNEYQQERNRIVQLEDAEWFYHKLGIQVASSEEKALKDYMEDLREAVKQKTIEGVEIYPASSPFFRNRVLKCEEEILFGIFEQMPKGGLLHVHSAAALSTGSFLELLREWVVRGEKAPEDYPEILVVTDCKENRNQYKNGTLLFAYQLPASLNMDVVPLRDKITDDAFMAWLRHKLSISDDKTMQRTDIWKVFNHIFARIDNLFTNREFYVLYHMAFFKECSEDNINYVEMRSGFQEFVQPRGENGAEQEVWTYADRHPEYHVDRHLYYKDLVGEMNPKDPNTDFLKALTEARENALREKLITEDFSFRLILNARRDLDPSKPEELKKLSQKVDAAIFIKEDQTREKYGNLIVGFDFVSEEDRGKPTKEYAKQILYKSVGTGYSHEEWEPDIRPRIQRIDFFLHDGESCWKTDDNVIDALLVSRHRIGHGFNLNLFRKSADNVTAYTGGENSEPLIEPVLEICPVSNQLLHYYQDIRNHSAYELMRNGICCVIANDDPLLLGNGGLSFDFWEAYVGMELPWEAVKASVYIAFLYQYYDYKENQRFPYETVRRIFEEKWDAFVKEMKRKYIGGA